MSIKEIFSKYDSESLAKALYTITSWTSNRGYLAIVDKLNRKFINLEKNQKFGNKRIDNYNEFQIFYKEVSVFFSDSDKMMYEDFPIDTGEVNFFHNERFYKVFIGNGSENVYESCFLIDSIVKEIDEDHLLNVWEEILSYEDKILTLIYNENYSVNDEVECPPEIYFKNIYDNFSLLYNENLSVYFDKFISVNEELYRFYTKYKHFPMFLPMMKECFLEKIIEEYDSKKIKAGIWSTFINKLSENYLVDREKNIKLMYPLIISSNRCLST